MKPHQRQLVEIIGRVLNNLLISCVLNFPSCQHVDSKSITIKYLNGWSENVKVGKVFLLLYYVFVIFIVKKKLYFYKMARVQLY